MNFFSKEGHLQKAMFQDSDISLKSEQFNDLSHKRRNDEVGEMSQGRCQLTTCRATRLPAEVQGSLLS
jgi:hypothetical protein